MVMNGFAGWAPFLGHGIAIGLDLFVQLVEIFTSSIQNAVERADLLTVKFDGVGQIGDVLLPQLFRAQLLGRTAGIFTGMYRTEGIKPVGERPKNSPAEKYQEQGKHGGESGFGHVSS